MKGGEGRGGKRRGEVREEEGGEKGEGRGGLSGNVSEEAFCLKSAPGHVRVNVFALRGRRPSAERRENCLCENGEKQNLIGNVLPVRQMQLLNSLDKRGKYLQSVSSSLQKARSLRQITKRV